MNISKYRFVIVLLLLLCISEGGFAQLKLPRLISDGMILQRDTNVKLWGWSKPEKKVILHFNHKIFKAKTDAQGKWQIILPAQKAGGPYVMTFTSDEKSVELKDILFGDVWVCAGQSNMEHTVGSFKYIYAGVIARSANPNIRQFKVPETYNFKEALNDLSGGEWKSANPQNVLDFSAVAYFFAKDIYNKYKIPIGIINASLGGSPAESWISENSLKRFPALYQEGQKFKNDALIANIQKHDDSVSNHWYTLLNKKDKGLEANWVSNNLKDDNWDQMDIPGYWGDEGQSSFNGVVWFRKSINIPKEMTGKPAMIWLGRIVDADSVFINGNFVGATSYLYPRRRYEFPAGILKEGRNELVVRVVSNAAKGGFVPGKRYEIIAAKDTVSVAGLWKYKIGAVMPELPSQTFIRWKPGGLYNAMIAPLLNYRIKGALWYQGESNANYPDNYDSLMRSLIFDWREHWKLGDFPFYYVQLPNFEPANSAPSESDWAELRQKQFNTLSVVNTGMAVTIGLGEWNDIHPVKKQEVGRRLALWARHFVYGESSLNYSGPLFKSIERKGDKLILSFTNVDGGLSTGDQEPLTYFSIAGKDKKYIWAKAKIEGGHVIVYSSRVDNPVYVRYAWADNPEGANLCNTDGLPASPFEASVNY